MNRQYRPYKLLLMSVDVFLSCLVLATVVELRPVLPGRLLGPEAIQLDWHVYFMQGMLWHLVFAMTNVYSAERISGVSSFVGRFTSAYLLGIWVFAGLLFFSFRDTSRLLVIYFGVCNYAVLLLCRYALTVYLAWKRPSKAHPVIVVGTFDNASRVAERILSDHSSVLRLVGFSDTRYPFRRLLPAPFLGMVKDLKSIVEKHNIEVVVIARSELTPRELEPLDVQRIMFQLEGLPVRVFLVPDVFTLAMAATDVEKFGDLVLIGLRESAIEGGRRFRKRILDVTICCCVLIFGFPLFIIIWLLVKMDSPGNGIISVPRIGENGRIFNMYKFRSMIEGAEHLNDMAVMLDEFGEKIYKLKDDPRVTRVGKWLRRTSMDELPQVFNVLKGEMSVVGPRPEQPYISEHYEHWQWARVSVPPGITGLWQVSGRADLPMHLNTEFDVYYVKNYSMLLDLKILAKTIIAVSKGKGAY